MRILITGSTGLVGNAIAHALANRGDEVVALVRDPERAKAVLPPDVRCVRGDVTDPGSIDAAMSGAELVFHAAGMPEQWQRDDGVFDRVNRGGTENTLAAALAAKVRRVVLTSTMDVFGAPSGGTLVETPLDPAPKRTAYERSKVAAERAAEELRARGLDVVYVNPGAVYGPAPSHMALNAFFRDYLLGKVPLVPSGGMPVLYIDGCTQAHLAAAERGKSGERYLVADEYVSMVDLARLISEVSGAKGPPPRAPFWLMRLLAAVSAPPARWFGWKPLIAPGEVAFLSWDIRVDATKAKRELGFVPTPLRTGVERTVAFMK